MIDSKAVDAFLARLTESARHLRASELHLPSAARPLAMSAIHDLEQSAEELRVTNEELKAQNDQLLQAQGAIQLERARFRRLFDLAPDALIVTDLKGAILDGNRACAKLLNADRSLILHKSMATLLDPESVREYRASLQSLGRLEEVKGLHLVLRLRTGKVVPVSVRAAHLPATDGEEARIAWALHDRSDTETLASTRDDLERERASREFAEAVSAQAPFLARAAVELSAEIEERRVAQKAARLAAEELRAACMVYLLEDETPSRVALAHFDAELERSLSERLESEEARSSERAAVSELTRISSTGTSVSELVSRFLASIGQAAMDSGEARSGVVAAPLRARGMVLGVMVLVGPTRGEPVSWRSLLNALASYSAISISNARLLAESDLRRVFAEDLSRGRSRAMSGLSHELRTPLHSILGYCELMMDGVAEPLPPKAERFVRAIRSSALHQAALVDDILILSKPHGQPPQLNASEVSVEEVVAECVAMVEERARTRGLWLRTEVTQDLALVTDRSKLIQILINLLVNAVKFTEKGQVSISAQLDGDGVAIVVRDSGRGIPASELPHIFEAFWQGSASEATRGEGTGLGLALVRRLTYALGGDVGVETEEGVGSAFHVRLPSLAATSGTGDRRRRDPVPPTDS